MNIHVARWGPLLPGEPNSSGNPERVDALRRLGEDRLAELCDDTRRTGSPHQQMHYPPPRCGHGFVVPIDERIPGATYEGARVVASLRRCGLRGAA